MLLFPLHRDRLRQVEGLPPDFVTSKLQGRDLNPGLNDLASWVCPTWSQLPQKPWASPNTKSSSLPHVFATLPALLQAALSWGPSLLPAAARPASSLLTAHLIPTPVALFMLLFALENLCLLSNTSFSMTLLCPFLTMPSNLVFPWRL